MNSIFFFFVVCYLLSSCNTSLKNIPKKLEGEYCDRAGNIMAFCMSFKSDTFHYGIVSMMFNYVGNGTYTINEDILKLNFCKADSSRYVDGTVRNGTIKYYKIKKVSPLEIIVKDMEQKKFFVLKRSKP